MAYNEMQLLPLTLVLFLFLAFQVVAYISRQ